MPPLIDVCSAVSERRLNQWIAELAMIGGRDDGGVSRETLTEGDWQARRWLVDQARALGCHVYQDVCANLFFERAGSAEVPGVLTGSHIDTQPIGGKYDGVYGVLAGLETIAALNDAGVTTTRPLTVVAWTNEEGARFGPGAMGSSFYADPCRLAAHKASRDRAGVSFGDALAATLRLFDDVPVVAERKPVSGYLELHIEQGPVLEEQQSPLGIVTRIQAVRWYRIVCHGRTAHAGTAPMRARQDAMQGALGLASTLSARALDQVDRGLKFTIGSWQASPNAVNTIAGRVEFTCDIRAESDTLLKAFCNELEQHCQSLGNVSLECYFARATTRFPDTLVATVERACAAAATSFRINPAVKLPSGAFHDAMYVAECCDAAMLFVPSHKGISHNEQEFTEPTQLYYGAWALAHALFDMAGLAGEQ